MSKSTHRILAASFFLTIGAFTAAYAMREGSAPNPDNFDCLVSLAMAFGEICLGISVLEESRDDDSTSSK